MLSYISKKEILLVTFIVLICLLFPIKISSKKESKYKVPSYLTHIVQKGESLKSIARYYGTSTSKLKRVNKKYRKRSPKPGSKIRIFAKDIKKKEGFRFAIAMDKIRKKGYFIHHVQKREKISSISKKYGIKERKLRKINKKFRSKKRDVKYKDKLKIDFKYIKNHNAIKENMRFILKERRKKKIAKKKKKKVINEPDLVLAKEIATKESNQEIQEKETIFQPEPQSNYSSKSYINDYYNSVANVNPIPTNYEEKGQFSIIVGSFKNERNARLRKAQLSVLGFNSKIITTNNGWYRVSCSSHKRRIDAESEIDYLIRTKSFKEMWLLVH